MTRLFFASLLAMGLAACGGGGGGGILPQGAVEVSENRVSNYLSASGNAYDMRTYRAPADDYFYITVTPSGRQFTAEHDRRAAGSAAAQYIIRRGCTGLLSRLSSRDIYDPATTTWTIVISC